MKMSDKQKDRVFGIVFCSSIGLLFLYLVWG